MSHKPTKCEHGKVKTTCKLCGGVQSASITGGGAIVRYVVVVTYASMKSSNISVDSAMVWASANMKRGVLGAKYAMAVHSVNMVS